MYLEIKDYSVEEKRFILSKVKDMTWENIPEGLKEFWAEHYRKMNNGK